MRIGIIYYPLTSLGPGERVGVWTKGCNKNCRNCMSKSFQEYNDKDEIDYKKLIYDINKVCENKTKKITISGGEPFDNSDFYDFLIALRKEGYNDILVYTGYTLKEIIDRGQKKVVELIDVLIDGPYIENLNVGSVLRGSDNQKIYIFNSNLEREYSNYLKGERIINYILSNNEIVVFGIPPKIKKEREEKYGN